MPNTVLVPHDQSDASQAALAWAADFARATGGSLRVLQVVLTLPPVSMPFPEGSPRPPPDEIAAAERSLHEAVTRLGLAARTEVVVASNVGEAIVRQAEADGASVIVMGTHGRGGLGRAVLGSVADHVVRHAGCPVVTVRGAT